MVKKVALGQIFSEYIVLLLFSLPIFIPLIAPHLSIIISSALYIFHTDRVGK